MSSSLAPAHSTESSPDELEERLRFYVRQIKSLRKTSLMYSSPELMERIRQVERDYETAVRLVYCRPPLHTPCLQANSAEQPTPDPAMDTEAQDPGTHHPPSRGPTEPRGPGPGKQPPVVSHHKPKHPSPDTENHNTGAHPPQLSFIPEKPMKPHPHSASSTHSPTPSTLPHSPDHTAGRDRKTRALCISTPTSSHRHNRADTTEHRAYNGNPNPTPRWDKFTRQDVPGQAPRAGVPHHTNTPHYCHCNDSLGKNTPHAPAPPRHPLTRRLLPAEKHTAKPAQPSGQCQQPQPASL
ncbi:extensin-like [Girardinichthys multiradiatus]|uniref:extensin-like n=1 Tax=Girardinichthys multiradiatus TaxID=208333 RepID=UPI001FABFDD2|nr:extensin-like [Girardinichthys multiradiatus]